MNRILLRFDCVSGIYKRSGLMIVSTSDWQNSCASINSACLAGNYKYAGICFEGYDDKMKRVLLSWSSGKDSAWALHILRRQPDIELVGLLTTLNVEFQRVAMHGTRRSVLEAQAAAAQLPLWIVPLPWPCSNEIYEQRMTEVCERAVCEHVDAIAFGDLFLEDVRAYRETQLKPTGLEPLFPLWQIPTDALARDMIAVDCGRSWFALIQSNCRSLLPAANSTLHSCATCRRKSTHVESAASFTPASTTGPCSQTPVNLEAGEVVHREGFVYADFQERSAILSEV